MARTFKDLNLPKGSITEGSVVLYKAWLDDVSAKHPEKHIVDSYDLNMDKDLYGLSEQSAINACFNQNGLPKIFEQLSSNMFNMTVSDSEEDSGKAAITTNLIDGDRLEKPSSLKYSNMSTSEKFLNNNILTIARIVLLPEVTDEPAVISPDGVDDSIPLMQEPFYDPVAGTLYATVRRRVMDISMSHNRILNMKLDKKPDGQIIVTKLDIEEIPLN